MSQSNPNKSPVLRAGSSIRKLRRIGIIITAAGLLQLLLGVTWTIEPARAHPPAVNFFQSAQDVINGVNAVRAARGLPAYQVNAALMAAAQAHSEYQASIGQTTHTGQGGSSVLSRAVAAGYGGGAAVSVIENVYGGGNGSPQQAVNWWQGDALHLGTLISTRHQDAGAGVASGSGSTYYTLNVGSVTGAPGSAATQIAWSTQATGAPSISGPTNTAGPVFNPILISTPGPDGSIVHVVQEGQTAWTIAATYKVSLAELLRINGLNANSSFIVPGQKLIIQPPGTLPTATFGLTNSEGTPVELQAEDTAEVAPPTRAPRRSPTPIAQVMDQQPVGPPQEPAPRPTGVFPKRIPIDPVLFVIGGLVVGGALLLLAGNLLRRGA